MSEYTRAIPPGIKTDLTHVILATDEINRFIGKHILLLIVDDPHGSISIVGAERLLDTAFYAAYFNAINSKIDPEEWSIIRGEVLDPEDLPYNLNMGQKAFVLFSDWHFTKCDSMADVTTSIESMFEAIKDTKIKDFAVITGNTLGGGVKKRMAESIDRHKKQIKEEDLHARSRSVCSGG